ncbi:MAG: phosphoribosylamine--glycine ligase [Candidatus Paceibacterota bacterium]|jgi:phosphoribosylamine--glycine ligase
MDNSTYNNSKKDILIIGGGGREHAVGWKISQSKRAGKLFFAPGNAGTEEIGENTDIKATDIPSLLNFAINKKIDITLALPDDPLALGIVDEFRKNGLRIFGPTKNSAKLESSKAFAKNFMKKYSLPTANFEVFNDFDNAIGYVSDHSLPVVVKVSGLALGKGVFICKTKNEAITAIEEIMKKNSFGEAGKEIVIEEFLEGPEISIHVFSDGKNYSIFPSSGDHKRIGEEDSGPNTGGMGTIVPHPLTNEILLKKIEESIIIPTLEGMKKEGSPFQGVLYPGLILTKNGPKILEFNARFGDPETQSYMRLLETDLLDIVESCIRETLNTIKIKWRQESACTIVLASKGYPAGYEKGKEINGIVKAEDNTSVKVFHAGTKKENEKIITNGGRVLGVSAVGRTLKEALDIAYEAINKISFEGMQYRKDIGKKYL